METYTKSQYQTAEIYMKALQSCQARLKLVLQNVNCNDNCPNSFMGVSQYDELKALSRLLSNSLQVACKDKSPFGDKAMRDLDKVRDLIELALENAYSCDKSQFGVSADILDDIKQIHIKVKSLLGLIQ